MSVVCNSSIEARARVASLAASLHLELRAASPPERRRAFLRGCCGRSALGIRFFRAGAGAAWGGDQGFRSRWSLQERRRQGAGSGFSCCAYVGGGDGLPTKQSRKVATEKHEFDDIQDLIVSPPSVLSNTNVGRQLPTLLEKEAQALEVRTIFSRQERIEAMNGLLDLLEQKGVTSGYAFEFVRHAGDLIDDLIVEAKDKVFEDVEFLQGFDGRWPGVGSSEASVRNDGEDPTHNIEASFADRERGRNMRKLWEISKSSEPEANANAEEPFQSERISVLASRVSVCAERRGLARLVHYFQVIGMKALNIPIVLPFVERGIDMVMAKVEFLRSLGVKYIHLPGILVRWPQLLSNQCDTLAQNVDYLVSLGLAHKDIGKMVIDFPQILGRDAQSQLHTSVKVLESLGVQLKDVKKLVVRYPILLTEDAEIKLDPLVKYLVDLGVQKEHIGTVLIRRPLLLDSDVEKELMPVGNYLKSLNASADDIDKILMSFPQLFCYDIEQDFRPTVLHLERLGVEPGLMGKLFRRHPQLLKNRHNFQLKIEFLLNVGLDHKDLGKVIYNAPQLMGLSVGDNMEPTVKFLDSIGINGASLLKVLKLKPMILGYSVETKLKPNIKFLKSIQIKQAEIAKLVTRHPQLLTLSVEKNLKPTVTYLLKLGFTRAEVADMVRSLPSLLGFSVVTVLAPKYGYLVDVMKRSRKEVIPFPQYFSYSLANRIIPRHQRLGELFKSLSLNSVYGCSEASFEKKAKRWTEKVDAAEQKAAWETGTKSMK